MRSWGLNNMKKNRLLIILSWSVLSFGKLVYQEFQFPNNCYQTNNELQSPTWIVTAVTNPRPGDSSIKSWIVVDSGILESCGHRKHWFMVGLIGKRFTTRCRVAVRAGQRLVIADGMDRWMDRWLGCWCAGLQTRQSMDVRCWRPFISFNVTVRVRTHPYLSYKLKKFMKYKWDKPIFLPINVN